MLSYQVKLLTIEILVREVRRRGIKGERDSEENKV